jgi:hypothetical protein
LSPRSAAAFKQRRSGFCPAGPTKACVA